MVSWIWLVTILIAPSLLASLGMALFLRSQRGSSDYRLIWTLSFLAAVTWSVVATISTFDLRQAPPLDFRVAVSAPVVELGAQPAVGWMWLWLPAFPTLVAVLLMVRKKRDLWRARNQ